MLRKWLPICILIALLLASCGKGGAQTVKVAVSVPLGLDFGKDMLKAAELALKEANGKAGKVTVELLVYDVSEPGGNPLSTDLEMKYVPEAVADPAVIAYLGPIASQTAKGTIPILNRASITQISASATWPGLTKPGYGPGEPGVYYPTGQRTFFRTVPSDEVQGGAAARWAKQLGFQAVYIANDNSAYGTGIAGIFEVIAKDEGLRIVGHDTYDYDPKNVTPEDLAGIAARVMIARPDLVYLGGGVGSNGENLVEALRKVDPSIAIMGPDAMVMDELISGKGAAVVEGMYGTVAPAPAEKLNTPAATAFQAAYQAAYGKQPSPYAMSTYEAMKVLLYAIEHAKKVTRAGVLEAMQNLGDYTGVLGTWHFDAQGDTSANAIAGMQIQSGAWTFVQVLR